MNLPKAPLQYDATDQAQVRRIIETEDRKNLKAPLVLMAMDGSRWRLVVDMSGNLSTVAA